MTEAPTAPRTARARARAEITRQIVDTARAQLATEGAAGLSLRAVARELGMVSSAVYRYFPSRDELLTRLIIDSYDALGDAVDEAEAGVRRTDYAARWRAIAHAVRTWALAHPHEWSLLYGSPVPGYQAPQDTIAPGTRVSIRMTRVLIEALEAGAIVGDPPPVPKKVARTLQPLQDFLGADIPDGFLVLGLMARTQVFGHVSLEIDGQFANSIADVDALYSFTVELVLHQLGMAG